MSSPMTPSPTEPLQDLERRRRLVYRSIDKAGFQWLVVVVAGIGFFTDAYVVSAVFEHLDSAKHPQLFASNVVLPMLAYVYWNTDVDPAKDTAINSVTLAGCIFGQLLFGVMGDVYGRRKMYGVELLIIVGATLGVAMSSTGADDSMNVIGWLLFWRFVAGVGVGADYPLSAVITSEFAPRRHRPRMLAAVFFMQPIGQMVATVVSIIAIAAVNRDNFQSDRAAVDSIWRGVVAVGAVPAVIALFFRLTIPESPRYILDVQKDPARAQEDAEQYFGSAQDGSTNADARMSAVLDHPFNDVAEVSLRALSKDVSQFFISQGNWRYLLGTAGTWFLVDWSFYGLGMNNPATVARVLDIYPGITATPIWDVETGPTKPIFRLLMDIGTNSLIVVSIGAVTGGAGLIFAISHFNPRKIQMWGFLALTALFLVIGATFPTIDPGNFHGVTTTLFVISQIFFNFGERDLISTSVR